MGHERVDLLPKTARWRDIVAKIADAHDATRVAALARQTTELLRGRLRHVQDDRGVQAAFEYLVLVGLACRHPDTAWRSLRERGIALPANPTPLSLARALKVWVGSRAESREYSEIAIQAASDAICYWFQENQIGQRPLFETHNEVFDVWHRAASGSGFCELARLFFARFTERYLNYFLEREASAAASTLADRNELHDRLNRHVDDVSRYAFETAKIAQSFAAGWFEKRLREKSIDQREIQAFLWLAFGKIRDELLREPGPE